MRGARKWAAGVEGAKSKIPIQLIQRANRQRATVPVVLIARLSCASTVLLTNNGSGRITGHSEVCPATGSQRRLSGAPKAIGWPSRP